MVQPALWAVMVALAGLWEDFGVTPAAVAGHSQGEVAAACAAGVLTVADGARVVVARSRVLGALAGTGAMASLPLAPDQARELLAADGGADMVLAAVNGPRSVVVSGPVQAVRDLAARVDGARLVEVDYASHSPAVEAVREELLAALEGITPSAGRVPFYSSVTGQQAAGESLDAAYWYRNLREPVAFGEVTRALLADGHGLFVEASPHPVLTYPLEGTITSTSTADDGPAPADGPVASAPAAVTGTLRRGDGGPARMLAALAAAWAHGAPVDWRPAYPGGHAVDLPTYAFQHTRYWPGPLPGDRAADRPVYVLNWDRRPVDPDAAASLPPGTVLEEFASVPAAALPAAARATAGRALRLLKEWLAGDPGHTDPDDTDRGPASPGGASPAAARLVFVTRQAVAVDASDPAPAPALAAVWGLVRAAQAEHRDTFVLADVDDSEESRRALAAAVAAGEPEFALRRGAVLVPRLQAADSHHPAGPGPTSRAVRC